jgi:hypothetical protein
VEVGPCEVYVDLFDRDIDDISGQIKQRLLLQSLSQFRLRHPSEERFSRT